MTNPSGQPSPLAVALEADLAERGIDQKSLGVMLTPAGRPPLSGGAISNWKVRGSIPDKHLRRMIEMFGPNSHLGRLYPHLIHVTVRGEQLAVAREYTTVSPEPLRVEMPVETYDRETARRREWAEMRTKQATWLRHLPDSVRPYAGDRASLDYPLNDRHFDFHSDSLVANIHWMPLEIHTPREMPYHSVVRLAAVREASKQAGRQYVVILVKRPSGLDGAKREERPPLTEVHRQRMLNIFVADCTGVGVLPLLDVASDDVSETVTALHNHRLDLEPDEQ